MPDSFCSQPKGRNMRTSNGVIVVFDFNQIIMPVYKCVCSVFVGVCETADNKKKKKIKVNYYASNYMPSAYHSSDIYMLCTLDLIDLVSWSDSLKNKRVMYVNYIDWEKSNRYEDE